MAEQESHAEQGSVPHTSNIDTSFDELAKGLADGNLSRRKALRMFGAALVGGMLASIPGVAWAAKSGNSACAKFCRENFPPGRERGQCISAGARGEGPCFNDGGGCPECPAGTICRTSRRELECCFPNPEFPGDFFACCPPELICGDFCCFAPYTCLNGQCVCPPEFGTCGDYGDCCPPEDCCNGYCCTEEIFGPNHTCCAGQCVPSEQCCNGVVCTGGEMCVNGECVCRPERVCQSDSYGPGTEVCCHIECCAGVCCDSFVLGPFCSEEDGQCGYRST